MIFIKTLDDDASKLTSYNGVLILYLREHHNGCQTAVFGYKNALPGIKLISAAAMVLFFIKDQEMDEDEERNLKVTVHIQNAVSMSAVCFLDLLSLSKSHHRLRSLSLRRNGEEVFAHTNNNI